MSFDSCYHCPHRNFAQLFYSVGEEKRVDEWEIGRRNGWEEGRAWKEKKGWEKGIGEEDVRGGKRVKEERGWKEERW